MELVPKNDQDMEAMFAKSLARSYMSRARYDVQRLEDELHKRETLIRKHARLAIEHIVESGKILFAIRQRKSYGEWRPWLDAHGIHYKAAEKRIKVAQWWRFFPKLNPDTNMPWSLSAAYDALPRIKDTVWKEHDIVEDMRFGPLVGDMDELGKLADLTAHIPARRAKGRGGQDPARGIKRRADALVLDIKHQIMDMDRADMVEWAIKLIADLEEVIDKAGQMEKKHRDVPDEPMAKKIVAQPTATKIPNSTKQESAAVKTDSTDSGGLVYLREGQQFGAKQPRPGAINQKIIVCGEQLWPPTKFCTYSFADVWCAYNLWRQLDGDIARTGDDAESRGRGFMPYSIWLTAASKSFAAAWTAITYAEYQHPEKMLECQCPDQVR